MADTNFDFNKQYYPPQQSHNIIPRIAQLGPHTQKSTIGGDDLAFNLGSFSNTNPATLPFKSNNYIPNFPNFDASDSSTYGAGGLPNKNKLQLLGKDGVLIPGLNSLAGLTEAYTGLEQLKLYKDAFNLTEDLTKTNLYNQAQLTNAQIADRAKAASIASGRDTQPAIQAALNQAESRKIKGTL